MSGRIPPRIHKYTEGNCVSYYSLSFVFQHSMFTFVTSIFPAFPAFLLSIFCFVSYKLFLYQLKVFFFSERRLLFGLFQSQLKTRGKPNRAKFRRLLGLSHLANNNVVPRFLSYPSLQSEREPGNEVGPVTERSGPSNDPRNYFETHFGYSSLLVSR